MRLVNCTPHQIVLLTARGPLRLPPARRPARLIDEDAATTFAATALPVPVIDRVFGTVVSDLPEPRGDTLCIVSRALAAACPDRPDLLVPGALRVRPPHGELGCTTLIRFHHRTTGIPSTGADVDP